MLENFFEHEIFFDEYITGNKFIELSNRQNINFCKTDYLDLFTNKNINIFITHNSDYHINKERFDIGPKCEKWFCQNKDFENENLIGIPIGLENTQHIINEKSFNGLFSSNPKDALQKSMFIDSLAKKFIDHDELVYLNFSIKTNVEQRKPIYDKFDKKTWVTNKKNLSWQEYYWDLATHKFTISPPGNGVDCHRIWESLYLRTIPIVFDSIHVREFKELPILIIKNWDDINYNFLLDKYEEFKEKKFDLSKIKMSYWNKVING